MWMVSGANGLFGSAFIRQGLAEKRRVAGLARGEKQNAYLGDYPYFAAELTDSLALSQAVEAAHAHQPLSGIVHAAAMTAVDKCETERALAWATNVESTHVLAVLAARLAIPFVYISTDYVFDGTAGRPYRESDGLQPLGVYAVTKAAGEFAAITAHAGACIVRAALPFGDLAHVKKDFVRWLITELKEGRRVRIVDDQISTPTHVSDLVAAVWGLIDGRHGGVFHAAGRDGVSRYEYAQLIARANGLNEALIDRVKTVDLKQPARRPLDARLDSSKLSALGLAPRGVRELFA